jgi:hypothetical protein
MTIEKSSDLMEMRTRDLPACSTVPQPTTLPLAPSYRNFLVKKFVIIHDKAAWTILKSIVIYLMHGKMTYGMGRREICSTGTTDLA